MKIITAIVAASMLTVAAVNVQAQAASQQKKREFLKVSSFNYTFTPNDGTGENGSLSFIGSGFNGVAVAGTSEGWTAEGNAFLPGQSLNPTTNIFPGECCGQFDLNGQIYLWPDPNTLQSYVATNLSGITGETFTFPKKVYSQQHEWTVRVPAVLFNTVDGLGIWIQYWTVYPGVRSQLLIQPGHWTITWMYYPPSNGYPNGSYSLVEGEFNSVGAK